MIDSNFLPWVTAFSTTSLIFVVLAIILFCIFAERYNIHKARTERKGNLQLARNLIKLTSFHNLEATTVTLSTKKTQVNRFLLTNSKPKKEIIFGREKSISPEYSYNGTSLVAQSECNLKPALT